VVGRWGERRRGWWERGGGGAGRGDCDDDTCVVWCVVVTGHFASNPPETDIFKQTGNPKMVVINA
jgi:hypothetical protein